MSALASAQRHVLARRLDQLGAAQGLEVPARLVEIGARQVETLQPHGRVGEPHLPQEAPGAAGDVEQRDVPLVAPAHELGDGAQRRTPHGAGGAHEQRLHLDVVEPRRFFREIAAGLEVEVLRVVVRHVRRGSLGLRGRGIVVGPAGRGGGEVGQHPAHAKEMAQRRGRLVVDRRVEPVAHGQRVAHEELRLVGQQLLHRRHGSRGLVAGARQPELAGAPVDQAVQREIPPEPQRLARQLCRHPEIVAHHCPTYRCR